MSELEQSLSELLPAPAIFHGAVRLIQPGDEHGFTPAEARRFRDFALRRRRASGAVRLAARDLCNRLGLGPCEFLPDRDGVPAWPAGWAGSFSHDDVAAVAIVARSRDLGGVGVDIEAPDPLDADLDARIFAAGEAGALAGAGLDGKAVFSIKEAVFKAVYPADRRFLEFSQVRIDGVASTATTHYGRTVHWRALARPRMLALAWW